MQLVGKMDVRVGMVESSDGTQTFQASTVHIHKCRFLEQSACANVCNHICKVLCPPNLHKSLVQAEFSVSVVLKCWSRSAAVGCTE